MTGRSRLRQRADQLHTVGVIYLVDSAGCVHTLSLLGYASLAAKEIKGSRVFTSYAAAEAHGRRVKARN